MVLPFISKKLREKDRIFMKFESSIEDKRRQLTDKLDFKNKDEINNIRWNVEFNDDDSTPNEKIYIVAGSNKYMEEMNKRIHQYYKNRDTNVKIINCFDIQIMDEKHDFINEKLYVNKLTTKGEFLIGS